MEEKMEDPKTVIRNEPRKSLIILFIMGLVSIVLGTIILLGPGSGPSGMGGGAGWVMIMVGVIAIGFYLFGRKSRRP
jgi:uncharacterized membrane protein HdeD (DUF308 family)